MAKWELSQENLQDYATKIRENFNIEEDKEIDYDVIGLIPNEIDRRRALFQYFIPDIFAPGKYDRRADVIDGCIYYLEFLERRGNQSIVLNLWTKRLKISKTYNEEDLEIDTYGYSQYHPVWQILGNPNNPGLFIPRLVQYIFAFKGCKRKLDINDYSLIFFDIFHSVPLTKIRPKMLKFLHLLNNDLEKIPLKNEINLKDYMKLHGFGDIRAFLAEFNKLGGCIHSIYDKSYIGLNMYLFQCPYPYHVNVKFRRGIFNQQFLTGGKDYIQELYTSIPSIFQWELLYRKFPPQTRCFQSTLLKTPHQSFLDHFDLDRQKWMIPWESTIKKWKKYFLALKKTDRPVESGYKNLNPTLNLLKICNLLEQNANYKNKYLHRKTKIPLEEIEKIRIKLDLNVLAARVLVLYHSNLVDYTIITLPGREEWKYQLIKKLSEAVPYYIVFLLEDKINGKFYLRANYLTVPENGLDFMRAFIQAFHGEIDYEIHKCLLRATLQRSWFLDYFDSKKWVWDSDDYEINSISFPRIK